MQAISPLDFYRFHGRLRPLSFLYGLPMSRYLEYPWTANALQPFEGRTLLDVGASRSPLTILFAHHGAEVVALDQDPLVMDLPTMATRAGMTAAARSIKPQLHDARAMPYEDGSFARVCSVSVLEHIPEDGDSDVAREMARVLAPGGLMALTLPFGQVYRPPGPEPDLEQYQRIYDSAALEERVIEPTGLNVVKREYFGVRMERSIQASPSTDKDSGYSRLLTGWVSAVTPSRVFGFLTDDEMHKAGRRLPAVAQAGCETKLEHNTGGLNVDDLHSCKCYSPIFLSRRAYSCPCIGCLAVAPVVVRHRSYSFLSRDRHVGFFRVQAFL